LLNDTVDNLINNNEFKSVKSFLVESGSRHQKNGKKFTNIFSADGWHEGLAIICLNLIEVALPIRTRQEVAGRPSHCSRAAAQRFQITAKVCVTAEVIIT
jgi:hypothetical protein